MVLKNVFPALLGAALLASSVALAAGYRPDQYFGLDLSRAALSPTPLGPPTQFALRRKPNSDQTGAPARQPAHCASLDSADPDVAVQLPHRRHLHLEGVGAASSTGRLT